MATSSTYTVTRTALKIAKAISRLLATERDPSNDEIEDIIEAINDWLFQVQEPKFFLKPGEFVWQRETVDLTLSSKMEYDLKPSDGDANIQIPLEILTANRKTTDSIEVPMTPMSLQEYQGISDKTTTGTPSQYYYERRLDTGKFCLNYIPTDTSDVIDIVYRQPFEIITDMDQTFDLDKYFFRAMKFCVAVDLIPEYRVASDVAAHLKEMKAESLAFINSVHPENSDEYFQPGID